MKWARLDNASIVVEIIDYDPSGIFHPDITWQECPDDTALDDYWNGSEYITPSPDLPPDNVDPPAPDPEEGTCTVYWHEFTGGWPGWGFKAYFKRQDITALALKVYDQDLVYQYALSFTEGAYPGEWVCETPAGYAKPDKETFYFEIIAGSAPVSELEPLTPDIEYRCLYVTWQP